MDFLNREPILPKRTLPARLRRRWEKEQLIETKDAKTFLKRHNLWLTWNWNENKFFFLSIVCFGSKRDTGMQASNKSNNHRRAWTALKLSRHLSQVVMKKKKADSHKEVRLAEKNCWGDFSEIQNIFFLSALGLGTCEDAMKQKGGISSPKIVMVLGHVDSVCLVVGFAAVKKLKTISKNEPQGWDLRENHGQKKFFFCFIWLKISEGAWIAGNSWCSSMSWGSQIRGHSQKGPIC